MYEILSESVKLHSLCIAESHTSFTTRRIYAFKFLATTSSNGLLFSELPIIVLFEVELELGGTTSNC